MFLYCLQYNWKPSEPLLYSFKLHKLHGGCGIVLQALLQRGTGSVSLEEHLKEASAVFILAVRLFWFILVQYKHQSHCHYIRKFHCLLWSPELSSSSKCCTIFCWHSCRKNLSQGVPNTVFQWPIHQWWTESQWDVWGRDQCWHLIPSLISWVTPGHGPLQVAPITSHFHDGPRNWLCSNNDRLFWNRVLPYNSPGEIQQQCV